MPYQCRDCSNKSRTFPSGRCPACGSANAINLRAKPQEVKVRPPYRLAFGIALWIYLIVSTGQKLGYW